MDVLLPIDCMSSIARMLYVLSFQRQLERRCVASKLMYLAIFCRCRIRCSPASVAVLRVCDSTHVLTIVISHEAVYFLEHGMSVAPSGRLPSIHVRPTGSFAAGV